MTSLSKANIILHSASCDNMEGYRKGFMSLRNARKWAHDRVGAHPDRGSSYFVSDDGICTLRIVSGTTVEELFPEPQAVPVKVNYSKNPAAKPKGKPVFIPAGASYADAVFQAGCYGPYAEQALLQVEQDAYTDECPF